MAAIVGQLIEGLVATAVEIHFHAVDHGLQVRGGDAEAADRVGQSGQQARADGIGGYERRGALVSPGGHAGMLSVGRVTGVTAGANHVVRRQAGGGTQRSG